MTTHLHFSSMPSIGRGYLNALVRRRPGLRSDRTLDRFEADVADVQADEATLARYRDLCGFSAGPHLPPTYPHVLAVPLHLALLTHPSFPLPTLGLVHVSQRIWQHAPIGSGEAMTLRCHIDGHQPARKGVTFSIITEAWVGETLRWRGETTVLARTKVGRGEPPASAAPVIPARKLRVSQWSLAEDLGRRYAAVANDRNPIHLHALSAKMFGFKRAIIHGMWTMARAVAELEGAYPEAGAELSCTFKRPVFLPSTVEFVHEPMAETNGADGADGAGATGEAFALWQPGTDKVHLWGHVAALPTRP